MKKKEYEKAINDSNNLLMQDDTNVGALYIRGCGFENLGEVE